MEPVILKGYEKRLGFLGHRGDGRVQRLKFDLFLFTGGSETIDTPKHGRNSSHGEINIPGVH
jgi:hypothetical protein